MMSVMKQERESLMKKIIFSLVFANLIIVLSACASMTTGANDQNDPAPLSRHDRLWNPHLERW